MAQAGVRIEGLQQTIKALESLGVEVADLKAAFAKIGDEAQNKATSFAPKASGALVRSIKVSKSKNRVNIKAGSAKVKWAGVQNYGWPARNISGSRFMQRTDSAIAPSVVPTLERELTTLINEKGF